MFPRRYFTTSVLRLAAENGPNGGLLKKFMSPLIDSAKFDEEELIPKQLLRPIGLTNSPFQTTKYKEKGNSLKDLFNENKTNERVKELTHQLNKSSMHDLFVFRKTNGKLFFAPKSYWNASKALYFPHLMGNSLANPSEKIRLEEILKGKISIVKLFGNKIGNDMVNQYATDITFDPVPKENSNIQTIQINWIENKMKSWLSKLSIWKLRRMIDPKDHSKYFMCQWNQLPFDIRESLKINNIFTGYILIVDRNLKIRWITCGNPDESHDEIKTLWKCVRELEKEKEEFT
ncbi:Atp10p NDAI_0J02280 [Naumovozyma dairenensis CBS 421]|uniref:Mitochondrial ATPase complex subunit ATP10 n=1 Tax=Naumovozyma dairenensis (strain ATCC 10597 / BCRC 20456 / CBS 421 / NBRC 0211 / NRRL Y-12639) TaxID=1071378 RepID=G0WH42_NAUDC|nr:hypothetical protein NDAI_0J02280 [Naumovozyma dairenensis CBS 421]CCD27120.1 hypothetical protein NDAI_0J02280 [Naumovozyma dairenensis CBS 421]